MQRFLSDSKVRAAKPNPNKKKEKLADGGGLFLEISESTNGKTRKYWRYYYRFNKKQKTLAIGVYPDVTLAQARQKHDVAREQLANGIDPSSYKKITKQAEHANEANQFERVAREWFVKTEPTWTASYAKRTLARLENDVFAWLGNQPINQIEPPDILAVLRRVEDRGALETAHRIKRVCGQIFRYAVATGRASRDPTADLKGALPTYHAKHFATLTKPDEIGKLLRAIEAYNGSYIVRMALALAPYVMLRPANIREALWQDIDLPNAIWIIPIAQMKARQHIKQANQAAHIVPLSTQALAILADIKPLTEQYNYVFPSVKDRQKPISDNTLNQALKRLGYDRTQIVPHGFRSMASTILNESGLFNPDAIERQLAHVERNQVRAAYNRAQYLDERRTMLQWLGDYLENLRLQY